MFPFYDFKGSQILYKKSHRLSTDCTKKAASFQKGGFFLV